MSDTEETKPRRINVAVNDAELAAINMLIEREEISLTESVRRLITYGEFVYRTTVVDGASIFVKRSPRDGDDTLRELVML